MRAALTQTQQQVSVHIFIDVVESGPLTFIHYITIVSSARRSRYIRIPVFFGDSVQAAKHDGKDLVNVLFDEAEDVLVIPEVERPLCYLQTQRKKKNSSLNNES